MELPRDAMSGVEDGGFAQDGTTAGLGERSSGTTLKRDLAWDRVWRNDFPTDDLVVVDGLITIEDEVQWKTGPAWSRVICIWDKPFIRILKPLNLVVFNLPMAQAVATRAARTRNLIFLGLGLALSRAKGQKQE